MRVSFINGIIVSGDAISNSVKDKVRALTEYSLESNIELESRIYLYGTDSHGDGRVKIVRGVNEVLNDSHFLSSDIIIYDFGIYYELFNSIFLAPRQAKKIVHFHNITPAELVTEKERETIEKSYSQLANVFAADRIIAGSPYNRDTLLEFGVSGDRITVLDYSIDFPAASPEHMLKDNSGLVNLLYLGRFVPSKGVLDLLMAVKMAADKGLSNFRLDLIGNETFSDKSYMEELKAFISERGLGAFVNFKGTVTDAERAGYYQRAHALVMPSYHEGFCVPVIEAYNHGCFVISYDAGNLPNLVRFGRLVKTGDMAALSDKIIEFCSRERGRVATDAGVMEDAEFSRKSVEFSNTFSFERFKERFLRILDMKTDLTI
ncbi:MAG: glycosyltransferase family 4 protein [Deltaproteobacteria bacterium]|nr:glycosyltransferase family 4 protein [Deltaproteobacteria bacterium]